MNGGGTWKSQNKILNGAYINFVSKKVNSKPKRIIDSSSTPNVPVVSDTSSVLGIAILGKMALGNTSSSDSSNTTSVLGVATLGQMILV